MYYDKRFQTDPYFPMIAFNTEQIHQSTRAGYVTTTRKNFKNMAQRIQQLNPIVLQNMINRMKAGEHVTPSTDAEKLCRQVMNDLDAVAGKVDGSIY